VGLVREFEVMSDPTAGATPIIVDDPLAKVVYLVGNQDSATMARIAAMVQPATVIQVVPDPVVYHQDYLASIDASVRLVEPKGTEYSGPPRNRHERRSAKRKGRR
jgi:hypothetical protein